MILTQQRNKETKQEPNKSRAKEMELANKPRDLNLSPRIHVKEVVCGGVCL